MDSKDSTLQGLMFSADNANKVQGELVGKTSAEGEPATDDIDSLYLLGMLIFLRHKSMSCFKRGQVVSVNKYWKYFSL